MKDLIYQFQRKTRNSKIRTIYWPHWSNKQDNYPNATYTIWNLIIKVDVQLNIKVDSIRSSDIFLTAHSINVNIADNRVQHTVVNQGIRVYTAKRKILYLGINK